jgi:hypothetical protein
MRIGIPYALALEFSTIVPRPQVFSGIPYHAHVYLSRAHMYCWIVDPAKEPPVMGNDWLLDTNRR